MYSDSASTTQRFTPLDMALLLAAVLAVLLWRFVGGPWIIVPSLVAIGLALGARASQGAEGRSGLILVGMAALVSPLIALPALWPCPLACQGLADYANFGGLPTWAWGMLAYLATFACGLGAVIGRERALGPSLKGLLSICPLHHRRGQPMVSLPLVASGCGLQPLPLHSYFWSWPQPV